MIIMVVDRDFKNGSDTDTEHSRQNMLSTLIESIDKEQDERKRSRCGWFSVFDKNDEAAVAIEFTVTLIELFTLTKILKRIQGDASDADLNCLRIGLYAASRHALHRSSGFATRNIWAVAKAYIAAVDAVTAADSNFDYSQYIKRASALQHMFA